MGNHFSKKKEPQYSLVPSAEDVVVSLPTPDVRIAAAAAAAKHAASVNYYCAWIKYISLRLMTLGAPAGLVALAVYASIQSVENHNSVPLELGVLGEDASRKNTYSVTTSCAQILLGLVSLSFGNAAGYPLPDPTSEKATLLLRFYQFLCGEKIALIFGDPKIANHTFNPPSQICDHTSMYSRVPGGVPNNNDPWLRSVCAAIAKNTSTPLVGLSCENNEPEFGIYTAVAVFCAVAAAAAIFMIRQRGLPGEKPDDYARFLSDAQSKATRLPSASSTRQPPTYPENGL